MSPLSGTFLMHLVALSGICLGISLYEGRVRSDLNGRRLAAFAAAASWLAAMTVCWSLWHDKLILEQELSDLQQPAAKTLNDSKLEMHHAKAH